MSSYLSVIQLSNRLDSSKKKVRAPYDGEDDLRSA